MKVPFGFLIGFVLLMACGRNLQDNNGNTPVHAFYEHLATGNIDRVFKVLNDSISVYEGSMLICRGFEDYYAFFQWDSVFAPRYRILEIEETSADVFTAVIEKDCQRIRFLLDEPFQTRVKFTCSDGKLLKIETIDYLNADWDKWDSRVNALTGYIDLSHPELSGFLFDQSKQGAENYMMAIRYYREK